MPLTGDGEAFLTALKREIASEHARVQLSLIENPSIWASGKAFKDRRWTRRLFAATIPPR